ncbi:MAG: hypothetical protein ABJA98_10705 [Acidobacteriota bacterium]
MAQNTSATPGSIQPCAECRSLAIRWLDSRSQDAHVNYYRCERCGHVWTLPKGETDLLPTNITHKKNG